MSFEAKEKRLKELTLQRFLSDDEIEEMQQLREELQIIRQESKEPKKIKVEIKEQPKKQKRSILDIILQKVREKPITYDELNNLKNKAIKEELKARIEKAKAVQRKAKRDRFKGISSNIDSRSQKIPNYKKIIWGR